MQKQLIINIDEQIYNSLFSKIGKEKISLFIEDLVRTYISTILNINKKPDIETAYKQMAKDKTREAEALTWSEETFLDYSNSYSKQ